MRQTTIHHYLFGMLLGLGFLGSYAEFPNDPKPCRYGDGNCIVKLINYFLNEKYAGDNTIDMPAIDPIHSIQIHVIYANDSPVNINLTLLNNDLVGFKNANIYNVSGFGKNLTGEHEIALKVPTASLLGCYKVKGRVLLLTLDDVGKSNLTIENTVMRILFKGEPYQQDGAIYLKPIDTKFIYEPERVYFNFTNILNGYKNLGDSINLYLSENWTDIHSEVQTKFTEAISKIFANIITRVFAKYPYEKYFIN